MKNKNALVIGAGISGVSASWLLEKMGFKVSVYDDKFHTTCDTSNDFSIAVKSPGISPEHRVVKKLAEKNIEIIGEVELAYRFSKGKIVAITGTNGKSTVSAMVYHVASKVFKNVYLGGNFGIPFSEFCLNTTENSISILELSSYQIDDIKHFKANIGVILNITPDHLGRYKNFENYAKSKLKLINHTTDDLILNMDDPILKNIHSAKYFSMKHKNADIFYDGRNIHFKGEKLNTNTLPLKGYHNIENYMAAILILYSIGVEPSASYKLLHSFKGLEHRMEYVGTLNNIKFINDSKSTNLDSLKKSLLSYWNIVLIAGGRNKNLDFSELRSIIKKRVKSMIVIGEARDYLFETFQNTVNVIRANSVEEAVYLSAKLANSGDIVLFSPGCSSHDMFKNFEERGKAFKEAVNNLRRNFVPA